MKKVGALAVLLCVCLVACAAAFAETDRTPLGEWKGKDYCYDCGEDTAHTGAYDRVVHWGTCDVCGEESYEDYHAITCTSDGVCTICGAQNCFNPDGVDHNKEWDVVIDAICHGSVCKDCGKVIYREKHIVECAEPGACLECGFDACVDPEMEHDISYSTYKYDEQYHWTYCKDCDMVASRYVHSDSCQNPGVCTDCGATEIENPYTEHDWTNWKDEQEYKYDTEYHWQYCRDCGEAYPYKDEHEASCKTPGVCQYCGATDVKAELEHDWSWSDPYVSDSEYHWIACRDCGEKMLKAKHEVNCASPNVCIVCEADNCVADTLEHEWNNNLFDKEYHWGKCTICGLENEKIRHEVSCPFPNECVDCGATDMLNPDVYHEWNEDGDGMVSMGYDETHHWVTCRRCDYGKNDVEAHYAYCCFGKNSCSVCYAPYNGNDVRHLGDESCESDAEYHWTECEFCDIRLNQEAHYPSKDDPGRCAVCSEAIEMKVPGDANGDGALDNHDIQAVLKYVSGWGNSIDTEKTDMNDSGSVTTADILMMLRKMNGGT